MIKIKFICLIKTSFYQIYIDFLMKSFLIFWVLSVHAFRGESASECHIKLISWGIRPTLINFQKRNKSLVLALSWLHRFMSQNYRPFSRFFDTKIPTYILYLLNYSSVAYTLIQGIGEIPQNGLRTVTVSNLMTIC